MKTQVRGAKLLLTAGVTLTLAISMLSTGRTANASHIPTVGLGNAASFAILAGAAITDVPTSTITGDVGVSPLTSNGLTCAEVTGTIYSVDASGPLPCRVTNPGLLTLAQGALTTAIGDAAGRGGGIAVNPNPLTPNELAGQTLTHGIYKSAAAMALSGGGTLTLNGGPNDVFIFQLGTLLTVSNASTVNLIGGALPCNVFWQVDSASIGTTAQFVGTILAATSITVANGSTIQGRLLAGTGNVTLINDTITRSTCTAGGGTPAFPAPAIPTATPTATPAPTATASPSAAPATATPKPSVASLPSTATLDDGALFVILPLLVIAFAVLYMVARARRRAARQVLTAPPAPVVPRSP